MRVTLTISMIMVMLLTGCAGGGQQQNEQGYGEDGYMGLSNSNPNMRIHRSDLQYSDDYKLADQALSHVKGIRDATVIINGGTLRVILDIPDHFSKQQVEDIEVKAYDVLLQQLPRYEIDLNSNRSRARD